MFPEFMLPNAAESDDVDVIDAVDADERFWNAWIGDAATDATTHYAAACYGTVSKDEEEEGKEDAQELPSAGSNVILPAARTVVVIARDDNFGRYYQAVVEDLLFDGSSTSNSAFEGHFLHLFCVRFNAIVFGIDQFFDFLFENVSVENTL